MLRFITVLVCYVVLICLHGSLPAQVPARTNTFIELDSTGVILDAAENNRCRCISFVERKRFRYGALVVTPDSVVYMAIRLNGDSVLRHVFMTQADVENLFRSARKAGRKSTSTLTNQERLQDLTGGMPYRIVSVDSFVYPDILLRINEYRALVLSRPRHRDTVLIYEGAWMKAWTRDTAGRKFAYSGIFRIENDSVIRAGEARLPLKSISRLRISYVQNVDMTGLVGADMMTNPAPLVLGAEGALFFLPAILLAASLHGSEPYGRTYLCNAYGKKTGLWDLSIHTFRKAQKQR